jgi:hypothetical protein
MYPHKPRSTVGVAAQEEPVEVTGRVDLSGAETWTTNDPRLTGTGRWAPTEGMPSERPPDYFLNGRVLETDDGTWRQLPVPTVILPDQERPEGCVLRVHCLGLTDWDLVLVGEGGYEGLAFIARATWRERGFDVHGYIVDTAAP